MVMLLLQHQASVTSTEKDGKEIGLGTSRWWVGWFCRGDSTTIRGALVSVVVAGFKSYPLSPELTERP